MAAQGIEQGIELKIADTSAQDIQLAPPSKRKQQIIAATAVVGIIVLAWFAAPFFQRWANATISLPLDRVRVATVTRGDLIRDVSVQGRVVAAVSPTLYSTAPGTITLNVDAGERVIEGQVVAIVDSPEMANQLEQAESTFEQRQVELERQRIESRQLALEKRKSADLAMVSLTAADREKRRADQAFELGVISVIDFEKAQDDLENAQVGYKHAVADADLFDERLAFEIRASELELNRQSLLVKNLQRQVDNLAIKSPVSGVVGDLLVDQKMAVGIDTPVMAVVDLTRFEIDAQIPESYADDLDVGMQAEIMIGGDKYSGELVAVSPEILNNQVNGRIRFTETGPTNLRQNQRLELKYSGSLGATQ